MSFPEAVRTVLTKYAVFSGRARRSEFWWFALFNLLVGIVAGIIDSTAGLQFGDSQNPFTQTGIVASLVSLALLLPGLGVSVRRLHDTGRSGWWVLLGLIPVVGPIILIVWFAGGGTQPLVAVVYGKVEEQVTSRPGTRPATAVTWNEEIVS